MPSSCFEGELGRGDGLAADAVGYVPGQVRQQLGGERAEEALDLAAACGTPAREWIRRMWVSRQTRSRRLLVKSLPWSL